MRRPLTLLILIIAAVALLSAGRRFNVPFTAPQIESLTIFAALIWGILLYEKYRLQVSLCAVAATIGFGLLTPSQFLLSLNLDVILFLLGTFLVAGYLEETFFFEHLA